jgi:penicillin-binding protein-related factor A (putative recombinase)
MAKARNSKVKGHGLENTMVFVNKEYHGQRLAIIEKIEIPRTYRRDLGMMVYLEKRGFDFEGVLQGGRAVCVEAKENTKTNLPYIAPGKKGDGIKSHQLNALIEWGGMGALVGLVWFMVEDNRYFWLDYNYLLKVKNEILKERKSIPKQDVIDNCREIVFWKARLDYLGILK